ncbi:MAG: hypothetical protein WBA09_22365 [Candidatus Acidiferrum sp.]
MSTLERGLVNTLLAAVTSAQASAAFAVPLTRGDVGDFEQSFTWQLNLTGAPTASCQMQGSLDGTNWFNLGTALTASGLQTISLTPVAFIRANLTSFTGGTSPTATVLLIIGSEHQ